MRKYRPALPWPLPVNLVALKKSKFIVFLYSINFNFSVTT